jgi:hypothetical protein
MKYSQRELLDEGFWDLRKSPILKGIGKAGKLASGAIMGATKGVARAMDYVAPEITNPLHRFEAGVRNIAGQVRKGADVGYGGLAKEYGDILLDAGYIMDKNEKVIDSGKNKVVVGYRIVGKNPTTKKPIPDTKKLSFLFDHMGNFKIINTSAQDTSSMQRSTNPLKSGKARKTKKI